MIRGLLALVAVPLVAPASAETKFKALFDGRSLAGWTTVGDAAWRVEDGTVSADAGTSHFFSPRTKAIGISSCGSSSG